jgi:hypothetical protein
MNVVVLIQSGDGGPVRIVPATDKNYQRRVLALQAGSVPLLRICAVLDGDERLERTLRRAWIDARRDRDWYEPTVLDAIPGDVERLELHDEERRIAIVDLRGMA